MTTKDILKRWGRVRDRVSRLTKELKDIVDELDAAADVHPQQLTGMPHGAGISNPTEQAAFRRMEILQECRGQMKEIIGILKEEEEFETKVEGCFIFLSVNQENVIRKRYREKLTQERVAGIMELSDRHVRRLEADALKILEEAFHEENIL